MVASELFLTADSDRIHTGVIHAVFWTLQHILIYCDKISEHRSLYADIIIDQPTVLLDTFSSSFSSFPKLIPLFKFFFWLHFGYL